MEKWASGEGGGKEKYYFYCPTPHPPPHQPLLVKYLITIQDGGIESLIYLAFHSKITAALQAIASIMLLKLFKHGLIDKFRKNQGLTCHKAQGGRVTGNNQLNIIYNTYNFL